MPVPGSTFLWITFFTWRSGGHREIASPDPASRGVGGGRVTGTPSGGVPRDATVRISAGRRLEQIAHRCGSQTSAAMNMTLVSHTVREGLSIGGSQERRRENPTLRPVSSAALAAGRVERVPPESAVPRQPLTPPRRDAAPPALQEQRGTSRPASCPASAFSLVSAVRAAYLTWIRGFTVSTKTSRRGER